MDCVRVCDEMGTHETQRPVNWSVERLCCFQWSLQHGCFFATSGNRETYKKDQYMLGVWDNSTNVRICLGPYTHLGSSSSSSFKMVC